LERLEQKKKIYRKLQKIYRKQKSTEIYRNLQNLQKTVLLRRNIVKIRRLTSAKPKTSKSKILQKCDQLVSSDFSILCICLVVDFLAWNSFANILISQLLVIALMVSCGCRSKLSRTKVSQTHMSLPKVSEDKGVKVFTC